MGKRRRLNQLISKWIKSDIPEDKSSVLLLRVTRAAPSPKPSRRPFSLPHALGVVSSCSKFQVRRNSSSASGGNGRRASVCRRDSRRSPAVSKRERLPPQRDCKENSDSLRQVTQPTLGADQFEQDWSVVNPTATLRGSIVHQPNHLPSYLSLACTINGYSTTTNYDPIRLARSRDASPHRIDTTGNHLTTDQTSNYSVTNHLLSPPNLVPLPTPKMTENALRTHHHQEFYSSSKTVTFLSKESHQYSSSVYKNDSTDGCIQRKFVSYESKNISGLSDPNKCTIESSTISKEYTNGQETKSFIQQRVERLYGPGALAQGFFATKRQKNRLSESESFKGNHHPETHKLNKTLPDKLSDEENIEPLTMKSVSSTALPVLRHLRPEFRAQLPLKKVLDPAQVQKSVTVPKLNDSVVVNGHGKSTKEDNSVEQIGVVKQNGSVAHLVEEEKESDTKDGHYFIKILEEQAARLLVLAERAEAEIETPDLSEEVICKLRSAVGKAKLLVSQKIQQFKGLCTKNINQIPGEKFPTTNEDLQGFWDMVMLQVREVDKVFEEINTLRENNWKEDTPKKEVKSNGTTKRKPVSKPKVSAAAEEARKQREEQRKKMIEERRKAMKAAQQSKPVDRIEIFAPESS
ncbi:uncharacterized protein LOC126743446 isoform X2 [Anthonomus grandis grandis]|uniref:uncharacterized protein LOC126743446 isoform X2 n=1 Tax=Anthonomus grandis grandis TaxID=2921223 RepID=UPI0021662F43|nr:uncharacterized protein LOC126743446 isoform X2 [Anthonomus grandis grandis]